DGIRLLQKNHVDNKPFMVMEFASYVHLAMGARPYRGTTFIDYGINITKDSHPAEEKYIGNAPYILQAKISMSPVTLETLKACYGEYISRHYKVLDESERWVLLERLPQGG
ncbi:MAG: hypothetical protein ACAI35_10100, partial [Candidatus Methylacidiphilales bacterium]|nr:hypothetical protein [Candidatus Methylacidiphilales bacterium]